MGCSQALLGAQKIAGVIVPLKHSGVSLRHMCEVLNNSAIKTDRGGRFHKLFVRMLRILESKLASDCSSFWFAF